jgi:hypothetical protein
MIVESKMSKKEKEKRKTERLLLSKAGKKTKIKKTSSQYFSLYGNPHRKG